MNALAHSSRQPSHQPLRPALVGGVAALFIVLLMLVSFGASAQTARVLNPPQPVDNDGKVEVLEFFAYGCGACANFEAPLEAWAKRQPADVKLKRVPSPARIMGIDSTVLFYTLEALGQLDRLHPKIFDAAHNERVMLGNPATLNKWLEKNGVDPRKYEDVSKSFSVVSKVSRAVKQVENLRIDQTPTIVVHGRVAIVPSNNETSSAMFARIDRAIVDARGTLKK